MMNWKSELQNYLPVVEEFLTSVLLEETDIEVTNSESNLTEAINEELQKEDIYLFTRDISHEIDIVIILDPAWFGLLSSIMLGIEEKTKNEVTIDLLKKFSAELSAALLPQLEKQGLKPDLAEVRVLSKYQLEKNLNHREYQWLHMDVEGLADEKVRAELLLGNPQALIDKETEGGATVEESEARESVVEGKDEESGAADVLSGSSDEFSSLDADQMEQMGSREKVISGRFIEFEEFDEKGEASYGDNGRGMDLLKDVEMDVSVELGRIELPLGKVLQLSKGSVLELEKLAGEPVDIMVNGHRIAHGEVVVIDEHFGVRISNLITTKQRMAGLK